MDVELAELHDGGEVQGSEYVGVGRLGVHQHAVAAEPHGNACSVPDRAFRDAQDSAVRVLEVLCESPRRKVMREEVLDVGRPRIGRAR